MINGIEMAVLILQYLQELDEENYEEFYMHERGYAERELKKFLEWLNKNQNKIIGS